MSREWAHYLEEWEENGDAVVSLRYHKGHLSRDGSMWLQCFMAGAIWMISADLEVVLIRIHEVMVWRTEDDSEKS